MAAGIAAVAWFPRLPPWQLCLCLPLPWLCAWRQRRRPLYWCSLAALAGVLWGTAYGCHIRSGLLPTALEQRPLLVSGRVVGLVERRSSFGEPLLRWRVAVEDCRDPATGEPCAVSLRRIQLSWYRPPAVPRSGERWQWRVRLRRPRGLVNPGGFDYEAWLVAQRLGALGSVVAGADNRRLAAAPRWSPDSRRGQLRDYLRRRLRDTRHRDLLLALLVGDGAAIDSNGWQLLRGTGTVHLFVVSGLHIAMSGGLVLWLARLWRRSPWGGTRSGVWPALAAALLYALLAGFGLSIQRALIMFAAACWALALRRRVSPFDAWVAALWLVLLFDPLAVCSAGFWFSFTVVGALLLSGSGRRGAGARHWRWLRAQLAVGLASLPVLLVLGGRYTLLALPANLLAIPWTTLVVLPSAFLALLTDTVAPALGTYWWRGADLALEGLWRYLAALEQWGGHWVWQPRRVDEWALLFAAALALLVSLPRGTPGRALAPALLLPLLWPGLDAPPAGACRVTVIDVGQGLSVLVETASHTLLYDTGPAFGSGTGAAELAVLPLLRYRGVARLDTLVVSHRDSDHAGGWRTLVRQLPIGQILVGDALGAPGERFCRAGQQWNWDGISFRLLYPERGGASGNNRSCVLQIGRGDAGVLLTGDIETRAEQRLLTEHKLAPLAVLQVPHHGSHTSSGSAFIARLRPRYAVVSSGYHNRYHHPAPDVVARYRRAGAEVLNTATEGALVFVLRDGHVAKITRARQHRRRYWQE